MDYAPSTPVAWHLSNAEAARDKDPRNFSIPRLSQRTTREAGDTVRLRFEAVDPFPNGITLVNDVVVEVTHAEHGCYRGIVEDGQALLHELEGTEVTFGPEHIIAVDLPPTHTLPYALQVRLSAAVQERDAWPARLQRVQPENQIDSGWRIVAAGEGFQAAVHVVPGHQIIQRFQMLDTVLDEPDFCAWSWSDSNKEYERTHKVESTAGHR